jgi:hypothetical protein
VGAINNAWNDDYERQKHLYELYERQTGGLVSALGLQQAFARQVAKPTNPEPNPVLLLTGDDE